VLHGAPGFVTSPDPRTLAIAALRHEADPAAALLRPGVLVGLLGIDLATRRRNRANGHVAAVGDGLRIGVTQSFGNCAQYISLRRVWPAEPAPARLQHFDGLPADAGQVIAAADTVFVASHGGALAGVDISHRGGPAGFVAVQGTRLIMPDYAGNRFFNTFGNFELEPRAALLVVDFASGDLLVLQGHAKVEWASERRWQLDVARGWHLRGALPLRWTRISA
jgi:predicted pyridoxine 5'-phosphate oxidase superfamily flavin-nucleotide-binding protein